jgi:hypothetical protein
MSAFLSSRNWTKTCETPSTEVERSSSMPLMVLTAASILSVTSVSISRGLAPGLTTVIVIVGKSIFGNRSTPSEKNEKIPTTVNDKINIVAKTGRRTHISANFCMALGFQVSSFRTEEVSSFRFQVQDEEPLTSFLKPAT